MQKVYNNRPFYWTFGTIFVVQLLLMMQGVDVCDTGFYATPYFFVFDAPECIEYNFMYYFATVVGGVWFKLFGGLGMWGLRLLGLFTLMGSMWVSYRILRPYVRPMLLCVAYVLLMIPTNSAPYEFSHNGLTTLLFLCGVWTLLNGLQKNCLWLIALSGFIFGPEAFTRLPNVLHVGVGLLIVIHAIYYKERPKVWLSRLGAYALGLMVSVAAIFGMMVALGHVDSFLRAVDLVRAMASNTEESHGIGNLIRVNASSYINATKVAVVCAVLWVMGMWVLQSVKQQWLRWLGSTIVGVLALCILGRYHAAELFYAFSLWPIIGALWVCRADRQLSVVCWVALFAMLVLPIGSDGAIYNFGIYSVWLSLGLALGLLDRVLQQGAHGVLEVGAGWRISLVVAARAARWAGMGLLVAVGLVMAKEHIWSRTYFDPGSRIYKTVSIDAPQLRGLYTTSERAQIITNGLKAIEPYVKPGDYLLCYESFPLVHYLTQTKPYLYFSWPWIYDGATLQLQFERAERKIPILPVILRLKFSTVGLFSAPDAHFLDNDRPTDTFTSIGETNIYNDFLQRNHYTIIPVDDHFDVALPPSMVSDSVAYTTPL